MRTNNKYKSLKHEIAANSKERSPKSSTSRTTELYLGK